MRVFDKGTRKHRDLARAIFQRTIAETAALLAAGTFDFPPVTEPVWPAPADATRPLYQAVWARVNFSAFLMKQQSGIVKRKERFLLHKMMLFQNAHLELCRAIDAAGPAADVAALIGEHYRPLPIGRFDDDRRYIDVTKDRLPTRPTPLEVLEVRFPYLGWRLETVEIRHDFDYDPLRPADKAGHQIYYACLTLMDQCRACYAEAPDIDELYFYFAAFVDLFYFGLCEGRMDDDFLTTPLSNTQVSPLDLYYPHDTRAFTAWDLPDIFHVLYHIPLVGEQRKPKMLIEKYLQKSLPFCCQRRQLIKVFTEKVETRAGAAAVIGKLFWCMLGNLYPNTPKRFDLRRLMRARQISEDKAVLVEAFRRLDFEPESKKDKECFKKENFKGCGVILNAFRMWIYVLTLNNSHYVEFARQHIDWDAFIGGVLAQQQILTEKSDIFQRDIFADTRAIAVGGNLDVYRYRKNSKTTAVLKALRETLEKNVYAELRAWKEDRQHVMAGRSVEASPLYDMFTDRQQMLEFCNLKIAQLSRRVAPAVKEAILGTLLKIAPAKHLSPQVLAMLQAPRYGGVTRNSILVLLGLMDIYDASAKPREMKQHTGFIDSVYDLKVLCWYLTVASILGSIRFLPLDATSVANIHEAFRREKYRGARELKEQVYEIMITVCCRRIATMQGTRAYGNEDVYFDALSGALLCAKGAKKRQDLVIPCDKSPVLRISLLGRQLVYGSSRDATEKYQHCPRCGSFHRYRWTNWSGATDGRYRCHECKAAEIEQLTHMRCWHCKTTLTRGNFTHEISTLDGEEPLQRVYFCKRHHKLAKKYAWLLAADDLRKKITSKE